MTATVDQIVGDLIVLRDQFTRGGPKPQDSIAAINTVDLAILCIRQLTSSCESFQQILELTNRLHSLEQCLPKPGSPT